MLRFLIFVNFCCDHQSVSLWFSPNATVIYWLKKLIMQHVQVNKPTTEHELQLFDLIFISAASGVMMQWSFLAIKGEASLTTENLKCERNMSAFDHWSGEVTKSRNNMLHLDVQGGVDPETTFITKPLDERESIWTTQQKKWRRNYRKQ